MKHLLLTPILLFAVYTFAQPTSFESRGVGGGGALFANSFNPFNTNELFVACDMSEVFHTTDLGASWTFPDFRQLQSYKIAKVSYTNNGNTIYAIDGSTTPDGSDRSRPMRSTDKGATWTPITDPTDGSAYMIFVHPFNPNIILLSDYNTLYASTDAGATFSSKHQTSNNNTGLHLAGVFFDANNIYVGTNEGIYSSTNGGVSFSQMNISGIPNSEYILSFSAAKVNNEVRFFCVTSSSVWAGIDAVDNYYDYKGVYTLTLGNSWQKVSSTLPAGVYPFFCGMSVNNTNTAYIAGASDASIPIIYKTTDAGLSWQSVFKAANNENINTGWSGDGGDRGWSYGEYPMGFDVAPSNPNILSFSDFGFVHISTDGGTTWKQRYVKSTDENPSGTKTPQKKSYSGVGIENTTCWQVTWIDKDNMYGCFSDIKGIRSTDAGKSWSFNYTGHDDNSMYYLTKNVSNNTLYAATSTVHDMYQSTYLTDARIDNGKGKVLFSNDNGASWQTLHDFQHPVIWLATDPQNPNRLYTSVIHSTQGGIYVSNNINNGTSSTWTKLTNPPRTEGHPFNIRVLNDGSLLTSYSGRRTSNFTASSGVFLSTDGGTSWQDRSDANMHYWTKDVVIDPHDPTQNTWYAGVFSGWGGAANNKGGLYKTTNRGQSWVRIHDEMRVTSCTFHPTNPNIMYFTSETNGLYYSSNRSAASPSFSQVASYPFRQPERVFYNPYDSTELWVSSFGNGMKVGKTQVSPQIPGRVSLVSPANNDSNQYFKVTFTWNSVEFAKDYEMFLSQDSVFSLPTQYLTTLTEKSLSGINSGKTFYWKVRGRDGTSVGEWSDVWSFSTKPSPPDAPKIIYPGNLEEDVPINIVVEWQATERTDSYRLQLSTTPSFTTTLIDTSGLTNSTLPITGLAKGTKYFVSVQGKNRTGVGGKATHSFITEGVTSAPAAIELQSPENNSSPETLFNEVRFEWYPTEPVTYYHIQISTDSNFDSIAFVDSTLIQSQTEFRADIKTSYWWRVRARNTMGWGPWSQTWKFFDIIVLPWSVTEKPHSVLHCRVSPNPASSIITLCIDNPFVFSQGVLTISDITGKTIYSMSLNLLNGKNNYYWNTDYHSNGMYLYRVTSGNTSISGQIIVKK